MGNYFILDDGYNSNILGATYALEVLKTHSGKKYIITPGFVEMNKEKELLVSLFSKEINNSCDVCILVKNEFTNLLGKYLSESIEVFYVNSFDEGFELFIANKPYNSILLIENDLPDAY
jgi:UDP-N-acetylmuramoyl-tripeptide--D-alanyl-D-alanine ligase